jgi:uncharacterized SAM-binding protein YcdF (DUF218 family)
MFAAKKIIAAGLLPPGIFILLLCWLGWRLIRKKRRGTGLVLWLLALLIWGISIGPTASGLFRSLERGQTVPQPLRGDVIVLLGGGLFDGAPDFSGPGSLPGDMMARLVTAVRVQRQLGVPIIVSGGVVYAGRSAEAPVIRRLLVDLGVPAEQVIMEDKSRDTEDNARFSKEILRRYGFAQPLLLTSAYHMRRSLAAFQRVGVAVTPLPANFHAGTTRLIWADFLPDASAMAGSAKVLREYLGLGWYKLTFWRRP